MNILNIIDTIYESKYFPTILLISIIILIFLFITIILLGLKDAKKSKEPKKEILQDIKDITFDTPSETEAIKEDVTFEIPVLTKNLENFKKSLEEEIEREEKVNVIKKTSEPQEDVKPTMILDKNKIDNTAVVPVINIETLDESPKEEIVVEEEPKPQKREILKELFKNRQPKDIVPPKVKGDQLEDQVIKEQKKEVPKKEEPKKVEPLKEEQPKKNEEQPKKEETSKIAKNIIPSKKETKYSGDDDF